MLKRIISAIFLALVLVPLVIAGGRPFSIAIGILAILGLKELLELKKSHSNIPNGIILFSMCMLLFLIFYEFEMHQSGISYTVLSILAIGLLFPTLLQYKEKAYETKDAFYLFGTIAFLSVSFHSFIALRNQNLNLLCYLILVPVLTDIFALFIGKYFGKRKIAPEISPNKTIAGCVGGSLIGIIIPSIFYYYMVGGKEIYLILLMSFVLSISGQLGDLLFSKIKRENNIKDYSNLMPGHGGILDRFDSMTFIIYGYIIIINIINIMK